MAWIVSAILLLAAPPPSFTTPDADRLVAAVADPPAGSGSMAPNLTVHEGAVLLTWLEPADTGREDDDHPARRLRWSRFDGEGWSAPITIVEGVDFFANWADVPALAVAGDGTMLAHWLQRSGEGTYAYDVVLARSTDGGATWTTLGRPHRDGTRTEHGFVSMVPGPAGVRVFWLDGRQMVTGDAADDPHGHGAGEMTLRTAYVDLAPSGGACLDARVCECCNTDAARTSAGAIVAYRDRGHDEHRDISVVRYDGVEWSSPRLVHDDGWEIAACPVNGPAIAAEGDLVAVAWFTGAGDDLEVRATFSRDGGVTFEAPVVLDDTAPVGRVDLVLADDGEAVVGWLDTHVDGGAVRLRRVAPGGRPGPAVRVAASSVRRTAGFPKLAVVGERLLVAWTEDDEDRRVRAVTVPLAAIPGPGVE
ncbi:MAG: sialidase family protein [Planctomycetota bacterium]|jgi:hypothetical protein